MHFLSPFDFQHQQQVGFVSRDLISPEQVQWSGAKTAAEAATVVVKGGCEPTSVLDTRGSPSPPDSCTTLSSSFNSSASYGGAHGGPHGGGGVAGLNTQPPLGGDVRVNGLQFDQSMFDYIFNNNDDYDPSGFSNMLSLPSDFDSQHQSVDDEFGSFTGFESGQCTGFGPLWNIDSLVHQQPRTIESFINHHHNFPSGFSDQPNPKRINAGSFHKLDLSPHNSIEKVPFFDQNASQQQVSTLMQGSGRLEEMGIHQQSIFEQIFESAKLVSLGNLVLAHGILARLNHQLSLIGNPLLRIAYYFKESLQLLLLNLSSNDTNFDGSSSVVSSAALSGFNPPLSLVLKLGAFKSFSELSPIVQFGNFTSNQAILEAVEMYERIHVIDFDIGYGGQWASFMQELSLRNFSGRIASFKITAFVSSFNDLELQLTRDNLTLFAEELNIAFDFNVFSMDMLNSLSHYIGHGEAVAVNLPIGIFSDPALSLPLVLRVIKQLSPKIVVSLERGCDRFDLQFADNVTHAARSYSALLESLEAVTGNSDSDELQKIEKFMIQPMIESLVFRRFRVQEKSTPARNLFISSGYNPMKFSNFTESQCECLIERTGVRGFHVVKKQSSLVLCWYQNELVSITAWRS